MATVEEITERLRTAVAGDTSLNKTITVDLKGEVLVCDPPRELSYSWDLANASGGQGGLSSRVTFKLAAPWGSTQLTIVHEGLAPGSRAAAMITQGWPAILSSLKSLLERGAPLPTTYKACA